MTTKTQTVYGAMAAATFALAALAVSAASGRQTATKAQSAGIETFETRIRPVLVERCFSCHSNGAKELKAGLRLDSREAMLKGGAHGPALDLTSLKSSLLLRAIRYDDPSLKMPPTGRLKDSEIAQITQWVELGAPWPATQPAQSPRPSSRSSFWAFCKPVMPRLPAVKNAGWVRQPIDRFVLARLEAKGLQPAPEASKLTLIRRATFDLTGLPPTPNEIQAFLADRTPDAFARLIDRLLTSPAYGERWGRHWLDVARYADSNGVDENLVYATAWQYRDYVVRAFNNDTTIDRFIQEQIAGDLLPETGAERERLDRIIATGYLSLGPKMLAEDDPVKQEEDIIDEQIDTLGKTFLGMTVGCARCHDHKFDPLPQTDYYALAGIFKSTKTMLNFRNMAEWQERPLVSKGIEARIQAADSAIAAKKSRRSAVRDAAVKVVVDRETLRAGAYLAAAKSWMAEQASAVDLHPVLANADTRAPAGARLLEAEDFVRGNVLKDRDGFGKDIGVLVNAGEYPNRTEYDVDVASAGLYQLDLRYASGDPRPIRVYINDRLVTSTAAGKVTGGFYPNHQAWFAEGVYKLRSGVNRIRFERDSYFPHIDKLMLTAWKGGPVPRTLEETAAEAGLLPEFLSQTVSMLRDLQKSGADIAKVSTAPEFDVEPSMDYLLAPDAQVEVKRLAEEIAALERDRPQAPRAMAVSDGSPVNMRVHFRGNYLTLGQECPRRFPAVMTSPGAPAVDPKHSGRLELAQWLTGPDNPLTARVFVNRVWRWHFGRGIVPSVDNFGALGDRPSDPALLDYLATWFQKDGWSLKRLHRAIMLSSAYRMSGGYSGPRAAALTARATAADPENRLHWRFDRRRLEAEEIRDSILAVSGRLDRTLGGTLLTFRPREYVTSTANADPVNYTSRRRSLYLPVIRSALYDVYTAFDFGDPTVMNGDRPSTTVAPQALFVMNSRIVLDETRAMAKSLLDATDIDDAARVQRAYWICFGRPATRAEIDRARQFTTHLLSIYASHGTARDSAEARTAAWQSLCKSLIASNEFFFIE